MDSMNFLGIEVYNPIRTPEFFLRLAFDVIIIYFLSLHIYYKLRQNREYLFTLFIINIVVFFICYLLNTITLSIGFAFGIFAIFSILRYRTRTVPIKEMTYMFISISVAIINAISNHSITIIELILTNIFIVLFTYILEKLWVKNELSRDIRYEKIELVKPEHYSKLITDLKERTGLNIHRIEIGSMDFLRDVARIKVYYYENSGKNNEQ